MASHEPRRLTRSGDAANLAGYGADRPHEAQAIAP